jgi:two-component system response regulator MprA
MAATAENEPTESPTAAHILIVDDESAIRDMCCEILADEGYQVSQARNGREAVERVRADRIDLVLMDIMMPIMDGLTASALLKATAPTAHVPIIIMSAMHNLHTRQAEVRQVAEGIVAKPLDIDHLLQLIQQLV